MNRQHVCLIKERGTFAPAQHVVVEARSAFEAKRIIMDKFPNFNILVLESR